MILKPGATEDKSFKGEEIYCLCFKAGRERGTATWKPDYKMSFRQWIKKIEWSGKTRRSSTFRNGA